MPLRALRLQKKAAHGNALLASPTPRSCYGQRCWEADILHAAVIENALDRLTMIAYAFLQYRRLKTARREKKETTGHRQSRPCQPYVRPFSNSSVAHRRSDARTAENGLETSSGVSKSAKVVARVQTH
jgi:hypothetical protein